MKPRVLQVHPGAHLLFALSCLGLAPAVKAQFLDSFVALDATLSLPSYAGCDEISADFDAFRCDDLDPAEPVSGLAFIWLLVTRRPRRRSRRSASSP